MAFKRPKSARYQIIAAKSAARARREFERDYKRQIKALRSVGQAEIKTAKIQADKALRERIRDIEKNIRRQENDFVKRYRHDIAILKRQGIVSRSIDARAVEPSAQFSALRNKFLRVLQGKEHAVKIPRKAKAKLKSEGFTLFKGRAIVSKDLGISRKGNVIIRKKADMGISGTLKTINLKDDVEAQARELLAKLRDDEYLGFQVFGNKSLNLYNYDEDLIESLLRYKSDEAIQNLITFKVHTIDAQRKYLAERLRQSEATQEEAERRRNVRRAAKRKSKKGKHKNGPGANKRTKKK